MSTKRTKSAKDCLIAAIRELGRTQGLNTVFTTFLELTALSLSAETDPVHAKVRRARYDQIARELTPEVLTAYAQMTALTFLAVREHMEDPCDILGSVYHELRLQNEWAGQFFTPDNICRMMGMICDPAGITQTSGKSYITINEPTCGSGAMVIGAVWAMKQSGFDYRRKSLFVAQDIDIRCVWMTYIQLTMYQIPAIVIHGNTLTMESWSKWPTPYAAVPFITERTPVVDRQDY